MKTPGKESLSDSAVRRLIRQTSPQVPVRAYGEPVSDRLLANILNDFEDFLLKLKSTQPRRGEPSAADEKTIKLLVFRLCERGRDAVIQMGPPRSVPRQQVQRAIDLFRMAFEAIHTDDDKMLEFRAHIGQRAEELDRELHSLTPPNCQNTGAPASLPGLLNLPSSQRARLPDEPTLRPSKG